MDYTLILFHILLKKKVKQLILSVLRWNYTLSKKTEKTVQN